MGGIKAMTPERIAEPGKLLTASELAQWLGVSEGWVRSHCGRREPLLPVKRLGKLIRFRVEDIERFLEKEGV
jgi:hypothetical protein